MYGEHSTDCTDAGRDRSDYQLSARGTNQTAGHAFFASIGANGRTCFSCHQLQDGWAIKPSTIAAQFLTTAGKVLCSLPSMGKLSTLPGVTSTAPSLNFLALRTQLFTKADFRIGLGLPANPQWAAMYVDAQHDPTHCENDPSYGIPSGQVSVYRRPCPRPTSASSGFGRPRTGDFRHHVGRAGTDLQSQFIDATLTHAQLSCACTAGDTACLTQCVNKAASNKGVTTTDAVDQGANSRMASSSRTYDLLAHDLYGQ